ncbi:MAG: FkbM family methyltransferase [Spirochaetia bacterium]|nr:FkbM family methyltransferase [Spirochaetia bacterium]
MELMTHKRSSIQELLKIEHPIKVVDIGANPIDGDPPYKKLLEMGLAHVYGFEPNPEALARLNGIKGPNETYVGHAVYDGTQQELKLCKAQGMTSLLEPNADLLSYLHGFPEWGKVEKRLSIQTVRLDDVDEIGNIDYLKIDIQGGELEVFRNGTNRLRDCLVVHTEVEFLPMYEGQPLFSEVELFLRGLGFTFHRFAPLVSRIIQPMIMDNNPRGGLGQVTYADAVFVRDFTKFDALSSENLKKIALILNDIYGAYDLVLRSLMAFDKKENANLADEYLKRFPLGSGSQKQSTPTLQQSLDLAMKQLKAGRLSEAEIAYQKILETDPNHSDALHLLGVIALQRGDNRLAVELISKAISFNFDFPKAHNNLGAAYNGLEELEKATESFRSAISIQPDFADALHNLGNVLKDQGNLEEASTCYQKAVTIDPDAAGTHFNLGNIFREQGEQLKAKDCFEKVVRINPKFCTAHHFLGNILIELGSFDEAISSYHTSLNLKPDYPEALNNLGLTLKELKRFDEALSSFQKALKFAPDYAIALTNVGVLYKDMGMLDEAINSHHKALQSNPELVEANFNLGAAFYEKGEFQDAIVPYRKAISAKPDYIEAYCNLGVVFMELKKFDSALDTFRQAITINPNSEDTHNLVGSAYREIGQQDDAIKSFFNALKINPDFVDAHINLGLTFRKQGKTEEAIESINRALCIDPTSASAHYNLGLIYKDLKRPDDSLTCYQRAIDFNSNFTEAYNNLGNTYSNLGNLEKAIENYRKALNTKPDAAYILSNILLTEHYRCGQSHEKLYELHREWDRSYGQNKVNTEHKNAPNPDRRIRIGFVSPNLGHHPVGYFIVPLLKNLENSEIETVLYSDHSGDTQTNKIRASSDGWRDSRDYSDDELSVAITDDEIDILVDLAGHSSGNRLLVFAKKLAPIQVAWAGYVGTTGLSAIDYLLSDKYSTTTSEEKFYSETVVRMPDGWLCYEPPEYAPAIDLSPCSKNNFVTFGSFSNPIKINAEVVSVWAKILMEVPNSKLLIKYRGMDSVTNRNRILEMFEAEGADKGKIIIEGHSPHVELLERYNHVDIALDPFPYSGGLTTYEALWMGVPVITFPGETFASRHSLSHLKTIGLHELVASNRENYIKLAVELANDKSRITDFRATLRQKMAASPICDGKKFAVNFTAIMREIWRNWCFNKG